MGKLESSGKPSDISKQEMWEAYRQVKANNGAPGVDALTLGEFESDLRNNLYRIWNRMSSGSYFPPPVQAVPIPKQGGRTRTLGVPTVADRVAQTVVAKHAPATFLARHVDEETRYYRRVTGESDHYFLAWAVDSYGRSSNHFPADYARHVESAGHLDVLTPAEQITARRQLAEARRDIEESARHWGQIAAHFDPPVWHPAHRWCNGYRRGARSSLRDRGGG